MEKRKTRQYNVGIMNANWSYLRYISTFIQLPALLLLIDERDSVDEWSYASRATK